MSEESQSYVVAGALLKCDKAEGSQGCYLNLKASHGVYTTDGLAQCHVGDRKVPENISTFGTCSVDGKKCVPVLPLDWLEGKQDALIDGKPGLISGCHLQCMRGEGKIVVAEDGQQASEMGYFEKTLEAINQVLKTINKNLEVNLLIAGLSDLFGKAFDDVLKDAKTITEVNISKFVATGANFAGSQLAGIKDYQDMRNDGSSEVAAMSKATLHFTLGLYLSAAVAGAEVGAVAGTVVPGPGNVVGAVAGAVVSVVGVFVMTTIGNSLIDSVYDMASGIKKEDVQKIMSNYQDNIFSPYGFYGYGLP
ncbi:DUF4280 domain-containing protein [Listeria booriae]|uniref:DUF4280 domain-containing protein n=1 Tax=Listeria booriae TaxID=1552123 RepID=UPI00162AB964|nr:DUF4280 domain-containing protein [Listeria booriae]MBC1898914.1 DUF4280 domain-containing protein [Listeria booriae]